MICHKLLLCLFSIAACFVADTVARLEGEAIVGGDKAKARQFPYHVSLQNYEDHICGGGIIGDRFILTAAHCVVGETGQFYRKPISVVAGTNNLADTRNAVTAKVAKIYVLQDYQPQNEKHVGDIAVLKLENPLGLSSHKNLRRLQLPKNPRETYAYRTVVISGFGFDWMTVNNGIEYGGRTDEELRFAEADVMSNQRCQQDYQEDRISEKQICARTKQRFISNPSGVCSGDSGGPLVYNGRTIVGVVSTSPIGCTEKETAAVYTRVSSYVDFIRNVMNGKETGDMRTLELIPSSNPYNRPTQRPVYGPPSQNVWYGDSRVSYNYFPTQRPVYVLPSSNPWYGR